MTDTKQNLTKSSFTGDIVTDVLALQLAVCCFPKDRRRWKSGRRTAVNDLRRRVTHAIERNKLLDNGKRPTLRSEFNNVRKLQEVEENEEFKSAKEFARKFFCSERGDYFTLCMIMGSMSVYMYSPEAKEKKLYRAAVKGEPDSERMKQLIPTDLFDATDASHEFLHAEARVT